MIRFWTFSEAGGRPDNEDACGIQSHPLAGEIVIGFVADGQGGRAGGGAAARLACKLAMQQAAGAVPRSLQNPLAWPAMLGSVDRAVEQDPGSGYTTLVGVCASESVIAGASSGDSAAILVHGGTVVDLSRHQQKNPPVGSGFADFVPFSARVDSPWTVVLMSDGVWKYVGWDQLAQTVLREPGEGLIEALQKQARLPGTGRFQDDFTVVVIEASGDS